MERKFTYSLSEEKTLASCYFLGGRTWEQFAAVKEIVEQENFDFSYSALRPLFSPNSSGPLSIEYQTTDGKRHEVRIGTTGRILSHVTEED